MSTDPVDSRISTYEHIQTVQEILADFVMALIDRGLTHDASKLQSPEREVYDEVVPKFKDVPYGTPEYRAVTALLGPALDHHIAHNRHHPPHFANGIRDMTLVDIVEMWADWCAAAERGNSNGRPDFEINQKRFGYSDDLKAIFENTYQEGFDEQ